MGLRLAFSCTVLAVLGPSGVGLGARLLATARPRPRDPRRGRPGAAVIMDDDLDQPVVSPGGSV